MVAISNEVLERIAGRELLIEHPGYWPTFEDFEVLSLTLDRPFISGDRADLRAVFLVFDIDESPSDPERKQATAELLFGGVEELKVDGFNHQNPIALFQLNSSAQGFKVAWEGSCLHHEVSFACSGISVLVDLNLFRKSNPQDLGRL